MNNGIEKEGLIKSDCVLVVESNPIFDRLMSLNLNDETKGKVAAKIFQNQKRIH